MRSGGPKVCVDCVLLSIFFAKKNRCGKKLSDMQKKLMIPGLPSAHDRSHKQLWKESQWQSAIKKKQMIHNSLESVQSNFIWWKYGLQPQGNLGQPIDLYPIDHTLIFIDMSVLVLLYWTATFWDLHLQWFWPDFYLNQCQQQKHLNDWTS